MDFINFKLFTPMNVIAIGAIAFFWLSLIFMVSSLTGAPVADVEEKGN